MVTVSPYLQNNGVGSRILAEAEEYAKSCWNVSKAKMTVIAQRQTLIMFYERRGYKDTGTREPFPVNDHRFGIPKVDNLEFITLEKRI
jgi:ribosomal protein S18 acetylase RimI-like enzyme